MTSLKTYWFVFRITESDKRTYASYSGLKRGCGVTAYSREDALNLLQQKLFKEDPIPQIIHVIEKVDISSLDEKHILPNIGVPTWRGIWFPRIQP